VAIALVTGASRGVGRGVLEGLAEAGLDVYCTGRNAAALDETARAAAALGGRVWPRRVDHGDDAAVAALFEEIGQTGPLDLLVNNAWGGYERMMEAGRFTWADPFWLQPAWRWDAMMTSGVRAAYVASQHAARAMVAAAGGLIVNVSYWSARKHIANVVYGMAKAATDKMTADMAVELTPHDVQVVSLYPGLVRTESVLASAAFLDLSNSESPRFIGRVIAALTADPRQRAAYNGGVCIAAALARELGITDVDGSSPAPLTLEKA
jgi:NAD(P)-dependent dehydrogenase (short-subunit alcohol dehydrogenase family)